MLKNILDLEGAQKLTKNEQKGIKGGKAPICDEGYCAVRYTINSKSEWRCDPC